MRVDLPARLAVAVGVDPGASPFRPPAPSSPAFVTGWSAPRSGWCPTAAEHQQVFGVPQPILVASLHCSVQPAGRSGLFSRTTSVVVFMPM